MVEGPVYVQGQLSSDAMLGTKMKLHHVTTQKATEHRRLVCIIFWPLAIQLSD